MWKPLALELARRGHHVTFVGPFSDRELSSTPNITYDHVDLDLNKVINDTDIFHGNYPTDVFWSTLSFTAEVRDSTFILKSEHN